MLQSIFTHQWIISPGSNLSEGDFEQRIFDEAFNATVNACLTRVTRGVTQDLAKCQTADGTTQYLWTLHLDLMNETAHDRIVGAAAGAMKSHLDSLEASLSTELSKVVLKEG